MLKNSTSFLYKYQPFNNKSLENLMSKCIWFSKPEQLNDPYDGPNIFQIDEPSQEKWDEIIYNFEHEKYPCLFQFNKFIKSSMNIHETVEKQVLW
jgi:hypothetical protein